MEYKNLKELCTTTQGVQISKEKQIDKFEDGYIRYLYIADFKDDNEKKYVENKYKEKIVTESDLVMANTGSPGAVFKGKKGVLSNNLFKISFDINYLNRDYLYYYLSSKKFQSILQEKMKGGVQKHLGHKTIGEQMIPIVSLENQFKIVKVLDKAKELIDKRKVQIEALDELVKSQFVEMFGDPFLNPKDWNVSFYEDICTCITDGEHATPKRSEDQGIYLLSARNVLNHALQLNDVDYIDENEYLRISKRVIPEQNDILVSCSGSVGRVCRVPANIKFQMVRSVAILKLNKDINPIFMEWLIDSDFTQQQILKSINQSSQANLFQGKIRKLKAIVPPIELQNQFADFVKQVDKLKFEMQESLKELEDNFNSLMQRAFKGELFN